MPGSLLWTRHRLQLCAMHASNHRPRGPAARGSAFLIFALGCAGGTPPPESPGADPSLAADPAITPFTAAQVDRGRDVFGTICAECHFSSEFRGRNFRFEWRRQSAWKFYQNVTTTMPENAPGALSDQEYVDVISYILGMNGYVAGSEELPATRAALDQLMMDGGSGP